MYRIYVYIYIYTYTDTHVFELVSGLFCQVAWFRFGLGFRGARKCEDEQISQGDWATCYRSLPSQPDSDSVALGKWFSFWKTTNVNPGRINPWLNYDWGVSPFSGDSDHFWREHP